MPTAGVPVAMLQAANSPYNTGTQEQFVYLHTDHLGTPHAATDATKKVVWTWETDAFGATLAQNDPDKDSKLTTINLRFPGQYYDAESGLHYNWNRYYDPSLGRYISSDPIGLTAGVNTFGYVGQSPLKSIDMKGRASTEYYIDAWSNCGRADPEIALATASTEKMLKSTDGDWDDAEHRSDAEHYLFINTLVNSPASDYRDTVLKYLYTISGGYWGYLYDGAKRSGLWFELTGKKTSSSSWEQLYWAEAA